MVAAPRGALSGFPAVTVTDAPSTTAPPAGVMARLRAVLGGSGEASLTKRLAGTIFIIRVISAALAYLSQILLARWMGGSDYGVYVYVWTWVLLLGSMMDFGISASAQKIIPEYPACGEHELLRGFLSGRRWLAFDVGARLGMLASAAGVWLAMIGQMSVLNRRLGRHVRPGPKAYDFRGWLAISLPILMVEGFYLLLSYTDVLVLQQFRSSEEVGVYFAVVKTLALVSFIHYAMSATTAHRFAEYHASGDSAR